LDFPKRRHASGQSPKTESEEKESAKYSQYPRDENITKYKNPREDAAAYAPNGEACLR
jgi:hypothetical protein